MANSTTTGITTTAVTSEAMRSRPRYPIHTVPPKIYLRTLNPAITCNLCKGYLIDATTIVECIHSFCHSCITMYLRKHPDCCPVEECKKSINQEKPNIKPDAKLQAIVYKLVPGLYEKELLRRRAFYKIRTREALQATPEQRGDDTEYLIFGPNENISLMLEYSDADHSYRSSDEESSNSSHDISDNCEDDFENQLRKPKYLQCPAIFTISNLKKFLLHKFSINPNKFCVEIMYKVKNNNIYINLPDYYTLMDVAYIYTWKRDAPMKFFYCVRAAHSPDANVDQNAVIYDPIVPSNRFQNNSRLTFDSTDQEQSSDADSDVRSEGTKRKSELGTNGALLVKQQRPNEQVNSTSSEDAIASSSTTSVKSEMTKTTSHSVNGNGDGQSNDILDKIKKDANLSPTASSQSTHLPTIKSDDRRKSPEKQQTDRRTNGTSPKPTAFRFRIASDGKPSSSLSRTTSSDSRDVKEKSKVKSYIDHMTTKASDSSASRFEQMNAPSTSEKQTSKFSDSKTAIGIERPKNRLLFKKEDNSRSFSPPLSAENVYDFDQHLLKEKLSEKKRFLSSIHLTPRIPSTETPLVQLPKTPKTELNTNLTKDNKPTESASTKSPASTSSASLVSAASSPASSGGNTKKPENKASKRKSREPVKNVAQVKYSSPNERLFDSKWAIKAPTITTTSSATNTSSATTTTATTTTNATNERVKDSNSHPNVPTNLKQNQNASHIANAMRKDTNNQTKVSHSTSIGKSNLGKHSFSTPSTSKTKSPITFKTPTLNRKSRDTPPPPSSSSSASSSSSETSIIINNVQRPNQADTPRPAMQTFKTPQPAQPLFISNLNRAFSNETEIHEIRSDDAGKVKVYGPTMGTSRTFESPIPNLTAPVNELTGFPLLHPYENSILYNLAMGAFKQRNLHQRWELSGSNSPKLNMPPNALPTLNSRDSFDSTIHPNVQTFLPNCKIPSSLEVTLMNDETESFNRSIFNNKNSNVVNSIEIVKLPDESGGEMNARFSSSIATSSPSNLIQTIEKESARTNSPVAINLSNNHKATPSLPPTNHPASYQSEFLQMLGEGNKVVKKSKQIKLNRPIALSEKMQTLDKVDDVTKEAQKRKPQPTNDGSVPHKVRKIQDRPLLQSKSSPTTQRPIPDLVKAKDEKRSSSDTNKSSTSACTSSNTNTMSSTNNSISASTNNPLTVQATMKKVSPERKAQNSVTNATTLDKAIALVREQAKVKNDSGSPGKYLPFTSPTPFWQNHSTPDQMASHNALVENLSQNKKNSGTIVD